MKTRWTVFGAAIALAAAFLTPVSSTMAQAAVCNPGCAQGQTCVNGTCMTPACSPACTAGQQCVQGTCMVPAGSGPASGPGADPAQGSGGGYGAPGGGYGAPGAAPPPAPAPEEERSWALSGKLGMLLSGSVYSDPPDRDFDTTSGFLFLAKLDGYLARRFSMGLQLLRASPSVEVLGEEFDFTVLNLGGTLKAHFGTDKFQIRPGAAFSYQTIDADNVDDQVKGFSPGAFLELAFAMSDQLWGVGEIGFISQPTGGSEDVDLSFAPIMYFAAGLEFGN